MTTIDAVVVALGVESYRECLASLSHLDHIYLLTDNRTVIDSACSSKVSAHLIEPPSCIEKIGDELLLLSDADWVLLIDPDERLLCDDPATLRAYLSSASADCVGYSMYYRFSFFGHRLDHTYEGLRKAKLVRPKWVSWPSSIHSLPIPTSDRAYFRDLPESTVSIDTDLVKDVRHRLARHMQWASIEAESAASPVSIRDVAEVLARVLEEYFVQRSCDADGTAGVLDGLLHLNKSIAALLFRVEAHGFAEANSSSAAYLLGHLFREHSAHLTRISKNLR